MNLFYRRYIVFLISIPLLMAGNSNVSSMKKMAVEKVEEQAKLIQEMVDMIYSFGELGFQEFPIQVLKDGEVKTIREAAKSYKEINLDE